MRFSAGLEKSRAKAHPLEMKRFPAGLKSSFPLLKQGAPTKSAWRDLWLFSGSHADTKAPKYFQLLTARPAHPESHRRQAGTCSLSI